MTRRRMQAHLKRFAILACLFISAPAAAQTWPSHLIKATIPFGAGSATDVVPRMFFEKLSTELGQPIVVENRAGAGGTVGTATVVRAEPDGYTILAHSSAITIAPAIFTELNYDATRDLSSALMIGYSANVMITSPSKPWTTAQEFIAAAKKKDASITFGSVGIGSAVHISAEKFRLAAGIDVTHVPYRGGSEVIADILGGRIDFYFCPLATALPLIQSGQVRALLVSTPKRVTDLPDVPAPPEIGLKDADSAIWFGVFVPSKAPKEVVEKLYESGSKVLANPDMQAGLKKLGVEPWPMKPGEMDALVAQQTVASAALVKAAGIK
ncbi:tripartite tricarboxylate transporter substrate-binding protein [Bradyrhizobium sp. G127]|uniref:Bug family tripartite tricarboxylate transporter substrate binding protein n=1 Tax=Bradyrhizobium sp. G127 TaxID=2904800 RepID=UPI001F33E633|nr:tripartite tricarboxylate transporter substrate-binding protein [Bradyrhizobium sp. G127]MCF2522303.1 tripartite tricarboxylate transporter substrate binding protein [Bradyrhizobium sp. G127]